MLTWITFPCYVAHFLRLDLLDRFSSPRRRTGMERIEHGRCSARHRPRRLARGNLRFHLFPGQRRTTNWPATSLLPPCAANMGNFGGGGLEASRVAIVQRGNNFDADAFVPVWTSQLYVSDWLAPRRRAAVHDRRPPGQRLEVTVENKMDHTRRRRPASCWTGACLIWPRCPPHKARRFTLITQATAVRANWVQQHGQSLHQRGAIAAQQFWQQQPPPLPISPTARWPHLFFPKSTQSGNEWQTFSNPGALDLSRYCRSRLWHFAGLGSRPHP